MYHEESLAYDDRILDAFEKKDAYLMAGECAAENISSPEDHYAQIMDNGG